ncbi:hypothetical protein JKF63_04759 [Porcisia hertigi]|uniref:Uncharacterized protein n=1 Tax=Porcisia hertigi TaxID=2761500 RepID=A0A836L8J6_9TRYP|nr:hypothetical protein JKF63_04759 [Porcisia hertigi]
MPELIEPSAAGPKESGKEMDRMLFEALECADGLAIMGRLPAGSNGTETRPYGCH